MKLSISNFITFDYAPLDVFIAILLSGYVSYQSYPIIIKIARIKALTNDPRERCVHKSKVSNLGGIGIFIGIITTLTFIGGLTDQGDLMCLTGALTLIFFTGLRDDLIELTALKKLFGQLIASLSVIVIADLRISSLYGMFGVFELSYFTSIAISLFIFIFIINAINLIDGVDGLAGGVTLTICLIMGVLFYLNDNHSILFVTLSLIGVLITFLKFNFSRKQKIFMGDTGSMVIGFLLAYQGIFLVESTNTMEILTSYNKPILVIALLSFPIMDTTRVFIIRILEKRSPFSPDKNHIHHKLLRLGCKHIDIMILASIFTFLSVGLVLFFEGLNINTLLLIIVSNGIIFSVLPDILIRIYETALLAYKHEVSINSNTIGANLDTKQNI